MTKLRMTYESRETIEAACKDCDVKKLADQLTPFKKEAPLAWNDALLANLVYVRRREGKEGDDLSAYGMRTWWLTSEHKITNFTREMVAAEGIGYLMPPDYLLNFLTFLPKKEQSKAIFETLFPSLLGVYLARDSSPAQVERLHEYLDEIKAVEPARRQVLVAQQNDQLKANLQGPSWLRSVTNSNSE